MGSRKAWRSRRDRRDLDSGIDYDDPDLNGLFDLGNIAATVASKAVVFAGLTSRTTLMGVKVLGQDGSRPFSAILSGVLYAADHGADVANMSIGAEFLKAGAGRLTSFLNRVFNYANKRGMLIVVAVGNEGADLNHNGNITQAFCNMIHVICVAATGPATATSVVDTPAYYTNFGQSAISVAAPGGNADAAYGFTASAWPWGTDIASWV